MWKDWTFAPILRFVMAGLDPAIHVFLAPKQDVDARDKPGHDEFIEAGEVRKSFGAGFASYRRVSRQPAASASSTEQNQRVPLETFILIWAYQRLVGW